MNCEKCNKRDATVHLTEIIKNVKSEIHLCEKCAREIGLNSKFSSFSLSVPDMLSFLDLEEIDDLTDTNACKNCGTTFVDYKRKGRLGCPDCYKFLITALEPIINNHHGRSIHTGKIPNSYIEMKNTGKIYIESGIRVIDRVETLTELKKKLELAIMDERYEEAAGFRDKIKKIENAAVKSNDDK